MSRVLSLLVLLGVASGVPAQAPAEPLVKQVKERIQKGVRYLLTQQRADGAWANTVDEDKTDFQGGATGLAVLALLNCGDGLDDPALDKERMIAITRGLNSLRKIDGSTVYVKALQTMAFVEAKDKRDLPAIKANVQWLINARVFRNGNFIGWDYYSRPNTRASDASNSQYAMLGLWYARHAGVDIPREVWQSIHDYYRRTQHKDGSWNYSTYYDSPELVKPSVTMTVAGMCGLYIAGIELNSGREQWLPNGKAQNCGVYADDASIARALHWLSGNFTVDLPRRAYYHLYGLERAGRLSGLRFFGEHDWYREGCEFLVKKQEANGSWPAIGASWDRWPHVNTSFALLFLSKGRTPIVISKLVHGNWPRREDETDWNNDRNDLRHLTEYAAKTDLFGKKAITWQTYDIARALHARAGTAQPNANDQSAIVADMRQSPILYITGHDAPEFQGSENALIKRFVDNGGFLFAEACCGSAKFDAGIHAWVEENWRDSKLEYVESTHPIWTCFNVLTPGEPFKLMKLDVGCRTVMLYSPQDLSCHWESNRTTSGVTQRAFELGANILAYGTGRVPPQPRLTPIEIADAPKDDFVRPQQNDYFQVRQIYHEGDWQSAPRAMPNLLEHVHKVAGLNVYLKPEKIYLSDKRDVADSKFIYMHGRKEFRVGDEKHLDNLRFTLENGGLLFADACCGNAAFDKSFRQFAAALFPKDKLKPISTDPKTRDFLFSEELNGRNSALSKANIQLRTERNGPMQPREPQLEGIQINGRWVVIYSKYDIGCALERSTSSDCIGYDPASALKIATAVVRYNTRP